MGLLVAYSAAMHRVLIGLECQDVYESYDLDHHSSQEEERPCSQDTSAALARVGAVRFLDLSALLARESGVSIAPDRLRDKCVGPDGEFYRHARAVSDAVHLQCERAGDYAAMDEMDDDGYGEAVAAARSRLRSGVCAADLKRPKTLEMIILAAAHKIATRMRAAAVRKP